MAKPNLPKDPVCGMEVDSAKPDALKVTFLDRTFYFCSLDCLGKFEVDPYRYGTKKK
jgi:YHS domain-containing protein